MEKEENPALKDLIGYLLLDNKKIPVISQKDATLLPWKDLNVDVVIESTGHLTTEEKLKAHLTSGAKAVVLSAPAKEGNVPTIVLSINQDKLAGQTIVNNASCTTNCIAPVAKVMVDAFGVEKAMMTTIHGYTSDQRLQDGGHKDYRKYYSNFNRCNHCRFSSNSGTRRRFWRVIFKGSGGGWLFIRLHFYLETGNYQTRSKRYFKKSFPVS
jgi:glyceraldehyde-3-phosphate dehydrogenase type I